jgi:hypothetical protein
MRTGDFGRSQNVSELGRRFRSRSGSPDSSSYSDTAWLLRHDKEPGQAMSGFNIASFRRALTGHCCNGDADAAFHPSDDIVGIAGPHSAAAAHPGPCDIEDQRVTGLNKIGAHAPLLALESENAARSAPLEHGNVDTTFRRLLTPPNTRWQFFLSPTPEQAPAIIDGNGFANSETWDKIEVPISLECGGFGQPFYTNFVYPFRS